MGKGAEPLVCVGWQRRVVTQGTCCDIGDYPVFPCNLQQLEGGWRTPTPACYLSQLVAGHPLFLFIIIFKKSQPASGVAEVMGLAGARLGVAELKLQLVSWLATAFCGAQCRAMPASPCNLISPGAGTGQDTGTDCALTPAVLDAAAFLQDLGSKARDFYLSWGTRCHLFSADTTTAPAPCTHLAGVRTSWSRA